MIKKLASKTSLEILLLNYYYYYYYYLQTNKLIFFQK